MPSPSTRTAGDFLSLFQYTRWANDRILETMRGADEVPARTIELFGHLLRAQDIWYGRVQDTHHATLSLWAEEDLSACAERSVKSDRRWQDLLGDTTTADLDRPVSYTNSKGTPFETPLRDILSHVINHSTHHRAQIALLLRDADIAPPATDYIYFVREQ